MDAGGTKGTAYCLDHLELHNAQIQLEVIYYFTLALSSILRTYCFVRHTCRFLAVVEIRESPYEGQNKLRGAGASIFFRNSTAMAVGISVLDAIFAFTGGPPICI